MHRVDFWNIADEYTDYEWAALVAQHTLVRPFGQDRDDIRAAWVGTHVIAAQAAKQMSAEELNKLFGSLAHYLKTQQDKPAQSLDMSALDAVL